MYIFANFKRFLKIKQPQINDSSYIQYEPILTAMFFHCIVLKSKNTIILEKFSCCLALLDFGTKLEAFYCIERDFNQKFLIIFFGVNHRLKI